MALPILGSTAGIDNITDLAWQIWSTKVRYIGVGAMMVAGSWSIVTVRKGISKGISELGKGYGRDSDPDASVPQQNLSLTVIGTLFLLNLALIFGIYHTMIDSLGLTIFTTIAMTVLSFLFVAVSSYIVGLVGASNNPVSGMTICALLVTAGMFLVLGYEGKSAVLATLGVAAIVCCAACTSADCSQDLKTGYLVGASPRSQQIAQMIGVCIPAFVIAPVLTLLNNAFGIGTNAENALRAPQATLFASLTKAIFGEGHLEKNMVACGLVLGVLVLVVDNILKKKKIKYRLHLMPLAVGIYLPITLSVPMMIGGLIRFSVEKKRQPSTSEGRDHGVLLSSGLIAGEAITGVLLAILLSLNLNVAMELPASVRESLSLIAFTGLGFYLWKKAKSS